MLWLVPQGFKSDAKFTSSEHFKWQSMYSVSENLMKGVIKVNNNPFSIEEDSIHRNQTNNIEKQDFVPRGEYLCCWCRKSNFPSICSEPRCLCIMHFHSASISGISYLELSKMTNGWSDENRLGSNVKGNFYRGLLGEREVAIKRLLLEVIF